MAAPLNLPLLPVLLRRERRGRRLHVRLRPLFLRLRHGQRHRVHHDPLQVQPSVSMRPQIRLVCCPGTSL
jgi:hypothetical protein